MIGFRRYFIASVLSLAATSCGGQGCNGFENKIREPGVAERLQEWVDMRGGRDGLDSRRVKAGRIDIPEGYRIPLDFDPGSIGLGKKAEARVLLDGQGLPVAVFFGERNLQGVVVRLEVESDRRAGVGLILGEYLSVVNSRVSTVCIRPD